MKWVEINPEILIHCILNGAGTKIRKEYNSHFPKYIIQFISGHFSTPSNNIITSFHDAKVIFNLSCLLPALSNPRSLCIGEEQK